MNRNLFNHAPEQPPNLSRDLLRGLETRSFSDLRRDLKAKQAIAIFAEDELVRKKSYDEMRCDMPGQPRSTFLMVFSPDGSKVASTHGNHNIYVTDLKSGKNIRTLVGHPRTPWCIAFHPTSNQIIASGCLGGEVRIWDLSGGSEVWTAGNQSVIASIAFHPNDRILVIATYNELYFWDWSRPEPFVQVATANPKEKIRYVAFDKLGQKLITGIANSPQTRWGRVRTPVQAPRHTERSASPYRLRITPRLVPNLQTSQDRVFTSVPNQEVPRTAEVSMTSIFERERRITASYRNLLKEYEQLVQRYLKIYKPPIMIDRGTDPMEPNQGSTTSSTQAPETSQSREETPTPGPSSEPAPEPSTNYTSALMMPSRIVAMKKQLSDKQNSESRKHKSSDTSEGSVQEKRPKSNNEQGANTSGNSNSYSEQATQTQSPQKLLVITEKASDSAEPEKAGVKVICPKKKSAKPAPSESGEPQPGCSRDEDSSLPSTSSGRTAAAEDLLLNIRPIAEEVRKRFLPIIKSLPACDRPKLLRRFENSRAHERLKFRPFCPTYPKRTSRSRPFVDSSSDNSSSDEEPPSANLSSLLRTTETERPATAEAATATPAAEPSTSTTSNISEFRTFIMELEQLLMTVLLTEIDNTDNQNLGTGNSAQPGDTQLRRNRRTRTSPISTEPESTSAESAQQRSSPVSMSTAHNRNLIRPRTLPTDSSVFQRNYSSQGVHRVDSDTTSPSASPSPSPSPSLTDVYYRGSYHGRPSLSSTYARARRLLSHRISAFMPTRVNYNRGSWRYRRVGSYRISPNMARLSPGHPSDEVINFSERPNAEANLPHDTPEGGVPSNSPQVGLSSMYSSIVQNLESSLNDVRNIRTNTRPGETSDMLSSFSESLENLMNQSDTILRNLGGSIALLPNYSAEQNPESRAGNTNSASSPSSTAEPRASFNDQSFYVRDNSSSPNSNTNTVTPPSWNLLDVLREGRSVVESDHNYPRNPVQNPPNPEGVSPLMTSLHLTISIQRQARLLRQQVESLERTDRAMFEIKQLQLLRQLLVDCVRFLGTIPEETRNTGMSSVRQMMAGTRISDSSPLDSQTEEQQPSTSRGGTGDSLAQWIEQRNSTARGGASGDSLAQWLEHRTASTSRNPPEQPQQGAQRADPLQPRPRTSGRKTYPPSRLLRVQRQNRRSLFVNLFPRRYPGRPDRGGLKHSAGRGVTTSRTPPPETSNPLRHLSSYSLINSSSLNLMTRRLEYLLTEQARPQEGGGQASTSTAGPSTSRATTAPTELGERILSIRLNECVVRMNRMFSEGAEGRGRHARSESVVTQDGAARFSARHFLSLIVDGLSKHMEELGGTNISQSMRGQIDDVLAMSLLLSDLLLLQLIDSIPPHAGMDLDVERRGLVNRIDEMCVLMLHNHSAQLTRSLQQMRQTIRHNYRNLGQASSISRRNEAAHRAAGGTTSRQEPTRRLLWSRYFRDWGRHWNLGTNPSSPPQEPPQATSSSASQEPTEASPVDLWEDEMPSSSSNNNNNSNNVNSPRDERPTASLRGPLDNINLSSTNSDENEDDSEWYFENNFTARNPSLYRTNNVNLVYNGGSGDSIIQGRRLNVPSVQVNDVPISDQPSLINHRIMSQRQRLAERVSELRAFPQMNVLRPRYLHPWYAGIGPFEADLDDPQRETNYDCDMITTVTPNHRIQMWDISSGNIPVINNPLKNVIVSECKIHNDASVDIAKDGTILVTLLPSGGYLNVTNKLGVYSLRWDSLGQCLYTTSFEQNAVSVALSPLSRHLVVGLASRRVSIVQNDRWTMARIFIINQKTGPGVRLQVLRELGQNRDSRATSYKSVNCIRWLPTSGQGLIYATNTGQLVILT